MYIESVPNRHSPPAILLRESFREAGKVRKRTLANLSKWPPVVVKGLSILLKLVFDSIDGGAETNIPQNHDLMNRSGRYCSEM